MRIFRRRLPPIPVPPCTVETRREELRWSIRHSSDPEVQRVRLALPSHLHDSAPYRNGRNGLWTVIAEAKGVAVGLAWSVDSLVGSRTVLLEEVAVVAEWQRQGVGTHLVRQTAACQQADHPRGEGDVRPTRFLGRRPGNERRALRRSCRSVVALGHCRPAQGSAAPSVIRHAIPWLQRTGLPTSPRSPRRHCESVCKGRRSGSMSARHRPD